MKRADIILRELIFTLLFILTDLIKYAYSVEWLKFLFHFFGRKKHVKWLLFT